MRFSTPLLFLSFIFSSLPFAGAEGSTASPCARDKLSKYNSLASELRELRSSNANLSLQITENSQLSKGLSLQIDKLRGENGNLVSELNQTRTESRRLSDLLKQSETSQASLQENIESLDISLAEKQKSNDELWRAIKDHKATLTERTLSEQTLIQEMRNLEARLKEDSQLRSKYESDLREKDLLYQNILSEKSTLVDLIYPS